LAEREARPEPDLDGLERDLRGLDPALLRDLEQHGFRPGRLLEWAAMISAGRDRNRVRGEVLPPAPGDVARPPLPGSAEGERLREAGLAALADGQVALAVLAGGMATRMGGVVKALVEVVPGRTFLDMRLAERAAWAERSGGRVRLWVMTSNATDEPVRQALQGRMDGDDVAVFQQAASLRLTPQGRLFVDEDGNPSAHATGHGDLPDALRRSGLLDRFLAEGGRYVWVANLDNLGAGIDPLFLGWHMEQPVSLTVEVAGKLDDVGGIPVRWNGRPVVLEDFRLPRGFDRDSVDVFNTNTLLVDAQALASLDMDWTYFTVVKQVEDRPAIQFERLVGELTSGLDTRFVKVPRSGPASRFLPVKDAHELEARRAEIVAHMDTVLGENRHAS
jgi:UTP--glucose-1-phosphate uridylyltransferase